MSDEYDYNYGGPSAGTAVPDGAQSSDAYDPINLYQAAKNLVEADGFMVIVYILAILGKSFYIWFYFRICKHCVWGMRGTGE